MTLAVAEWAWKQNVPAIPKILLVAIAEAGGASREFELDEIKFSNRCGIPLADIPGTLDQLERVGLLIVMDKTSSGDGITIVFLNFPLQDWEIRLPKHPPRPNNLPASLYVFSAAPDVTKIGITTNLASRQRALEKASGRRLTLAWHFGATVTEVRGFEQQLLRMFEASRIHGEWVSVSADEVIKAAMEICGDPGVRA